MKGTGRGGVAKEAALVMLCLALITTPSNVAVAQASNPDSARRANAQRAADICSDFVHARLLTPQRAADEAVRRGFTRTPGLTQTDVEVVYLSSPRVTVMVQVYDFGAGRRSNCSVDAGLDNAGYLALQTDYVTRDPSDPFGFWPAWSRTAGPNYVRWDRSQCKTGSTLTVSTSSLNAGALSFTRVDRPGVSLEEVSKAYCL
jgi:hypothetical protein